MTQRLVLFCGVLAMSCVFAGCTEEATGNVRVHVYGESFIEDGIAAEDMNDGWSVSFDKFEVVVEDVVIGGETVSSSGPIDIAVNTDGTGHALGVASMDVGTYTNQSYVISRVSMAGSATKDGVTKTFDWVFDQKTQYTKCEATTKVTEGADAMFQVTVHADHFFYDSLVAEEPQVVFQALADADANDDGAITPDELKATDIGAYDAGSSGDVNDLWSWLIAQSRTLGHVDGEGHCDARAAD